MKQKVLLLSPLLVAAAIGWWWRKADPARSGDPTGQPRNAFGRTVDQALQLRLQGWGLVRIGRERKIGTGTLQRRNLTERGPGRPWSVELRAFAADAVRRSKPDVCAQTD